MDISELAMRIGEDDATICSQISKCQIYIIWKITILQTWTFVDVKNEWLNESI
jgi:hypothetical protein